jgi:glycine/serine hydroxymethyltransferase
MGTQSLTRQGLGVPEMPAVAGAIARGLRPGTDLGALRGEVAAIRRR